MSSTASSAYHCIADDTFDASELTRGPWDPAHQHAGPPTALVCRAIERAASAHGLTHMARLTGNLLRPVLLGKVIVEVQEDYVGRNAAHYSARLSSGGKEVARFTALMQREVETPTPPGTPGHPLPGVARLPDACEPVVMPFAGSQRGTPTWLRTGSPKGANGLAPAASGFACGTRSSTTRRPAPTSASRSLRIRVTASARRSTSSATASSTAT